MLSAVLNKSALRSRRILGRRVVAFCSDSKAQESFSEFVARNKANDFLLDHMLRKRGSK